MNTIEAPYHITSRRRKMGMDQVNATLVRRSATLRRQRAEFLALLSHELLTPLTCILGWSQLAQTQDDVIAIQHSLNVIERNVRRQKRLLDELLDEMQFTTHGRLVFNPKKIDLWQLVDHYGDGMIRPDRDKQLSLKLEIPERQEIHQAG